MPPVTLDLTTDLTSTTGRPEAVGQFARSVLAALTQLVPCDIACVFEQGDGEFVVRCAAGLHAELAPPGHVVKAAGYPSLRSAIDGGRAEVLTASQVAGEGDPFEEADSLPRRRARLVLPLLDTLRSGRRGAFGVLTLDRSEGEFSQSDVERATALARALVPALGAERAAERHERERLRLEEERRILTIELTSGRDAATAVAATREASTRRLVRAAQQIAPTDTPVLLTGEPGAGKGTFARALHAWSRRAAGPFVPFDCAAFPPQDLELELVGRVGRGPGGAARFERLGRLAAANGGTLLLEGVGCLPSSAQAQLLRVLENGTFTPVGAEHAVRVDVRIVTAADVRPGHGEEIAGLEGVGEDLRAALDGMHFELPPLRERRDDIPVIAHELLIAIGRRGGRGPWELDAATLRVLADHPWPGNVRELANCLERATLGAPAGRLAVDPSSGPARDEVWPTIDELQGDYIRKVLARTRGKVYGPGGAAEIVGLKPSTLQSRMQKLGVQRLPKSS